MPETPEPPGVVQVTEYVDEQNRKIRVFSPGFADGAAPGPSVGGIERVEMAI